MAEINRPKRAGAYPNRDIDCEMALDDSFRALIDKAQMSEWHVTELLDAMESLALNHRIAYFADPCPADDPCA